MIYRKVIITINWKVVRRRYKLTSTLPSRPGLPIGLPDYLYKTIYILTDRPLKVHIVHCIHVKTS